MSTVKLIGLGGLIGISLSGCATTVEIRHTVPCGSLVPPSLVHPVAGARLPMVDGDGSWFTFGDAQTTQLEKANQQKQEALGIVTRCEERDRSIVIVKTKLKHLSSDKK